MTPFDLAYTIETLKVLKINIAVMIANVGVHLSLCRGKAVKKLTLWNTLH